MKAGYFILLLFVVTGVSKAEQYPSKPITLVAPWGHGGASDIAARLFAESVKKYIDAPVNVENMPGDGGTLGSNFVFRSEPDGYTLLLASVGTTSGPAAYGKALPYRYEDFTMIGLLEINPLVCSVSVNSPHKTIKSLMDTIRIHDQRLVFSSSGFGNIQQLAAYELMRLSGIKDPAIQADMKVFQGGYLTNSAAVQGSVDFVCSNMSSAMPLILENKLMPLLVNTPKRHSKLPSVPTAAEQGLRELEYLVGWSAIFAPPELPKGVLKHLEDVMAKLSLDRAWRRLTLSVGSIPSVMNPEQTRMFVTRQYEELRAMVRNLNQTN